MIRTRAIGAPVWSAATVPAAFRAASGWRFGQVVPAAWDRAPRLAVLEMLSDLATYGLVAGACSIGEDVMVWPGDVAAQSGCNGDAGRRERGGSESAGCESVGCERGEADVAGNEHDSVGGTGGCYFSGAGYPSLPADDPTTPWSFNAQRAEFVATPADANNEVPGYALLAGARAAAAQLRIPFVNTALLTLTGALAAAVPPQRGEAPPAELVVPFPLPEAGPFVMQLKPSVRRALARQGNVLRERRRQILGLPVGVDAALLDAHIEAHFVLPLARRYLDGCDGIGTPGTPGVPGTPGTPGTPGGTRVHLVASASQAASALTARRFAVSQFDAGEPAGENLFALTLRRLFYQHRRSAGHRYFDISPLALHRRVGRLPSVETGVGHAMLAALQMQFLESNLAARG